VKFCLNSILILVTYFQKLIGKDVMYTKQILFALVAISTISLSGCMGAMMGSSYDRGEATWKARCERYGFEPGTEGFAKCMSTEYNAYRNREQKRLQNIWSD